MADLQYSGPNDSADGADGGAPGAPGAFGGSDPSQVTGQDPVSIFRIPLSYDTGLGGSAFGGGQGDPTNEPNQYPGDMPIAGTPLDGTGLDGTQGASQTQIETPGTSFQVSSPNNFAGQPGGGSGTYFVDAPVAVGGHGDSTMVTGQYPPENPIIPGGFYPDNSGAGDGSVKVGGYLKGNRG